MVLQIRNYIQLQGDNPLDALITGTAYRAYLVENLALKDGSQDAAIHYGVDLASVHSAIAFYYDNQTTIEAAILEARNLGQPLGAHDAKTALDEIKLRNQST